MRSRSSAVVTTWRTPTASAIKAALGPVDVIVRSTPWDFVSTWLWRKLIATERSGSRPEVRAKSSDIRQSTASLSQRRTRAYKKYREPSHWGQPFIHDLRIAVHKMSRPPWIAFCRRCYTAPRLGLRCS